MMHSNSLFEIWYRENVITLHGKNKLALESLKVIYYEKDEKFPYKINLRLEIRRICSIITTGGKVKKISYCGKPTENGLMD